MIEPKETIYSILNTIDDVTVYQNTPKVLKDLPCIVFFIEGNTPEYDLGKEIAYQDITVVIDIFGRNSKESGSLLSTLVSIMINSDYRMVFCSDIPDENTSHITTRFNLVG